MTCLEQKVERDITKIIATLADITVRRDADALEEFTRPGTPACKILARVSHPPKTASDVTLRRQFHEAISAATAKMPKLR